MSSRINVNTTFNTLYQDVLIPNSWRIPVTDADLKRFSIIVQLSHTNTGCKSANFKDKEMMINAFLIGGQKRSSKDTSATKFIASYKSSDGNFLLNFNSNDLLNHGLKAPVFLQWDVEPMENLGQFSNIRIDTGIYRQSPTYINSSLTVVGFDSNSALLEICCQGYLAQKPNFYPFKKMQVAPAVATMDESCLNSYAWVTNTVKFESNVDVVIGQDFTKSPLHCVTYHVQNLRPSTSYYSFLFFDGFPAIKRSEKFTTLTHDSSCQLKTNLAFCNNVNYATPKSSYSGGHIAYAKYLDQYAKQVFLNFSSAMQIVSCDANLDSRYSLFRSCEDCRLAYKNWLCSQLFPRCTSLNWIQSKKKKCRKLDQHAVAFRKSYVNTNDPVHKATYQDFYEIKPCIDLCWNMVQSCPRSFGLMCPSFLLSEENSEYRHCTGQMSICSPSSSPSQNSCSLLGVFAIAIVLFMKLMNF